jgi:hypothetical protein
MEAPGVRTPAGQPVRVAIWVAHVAFPLVGLGLWFNDPADAAAAGCQSTVTPFNGEHNAGVQALSTRNFADAQGPLRQVTS